ncbi:hypothetical protein J3D47_002824 [Pseudomonas laurylsulfativorans]|uniref:hypothetical protein n=1 Tax=Pseudomonas laurylsulfativorans TaxID=1943631 RepID=UPI00209DF918|nr:hypothetical protein [Pseudomonas laurylsulfativorans]MCP1418581.1 hypothetical protein [Pseudomonas laurylsulfativorans]
MTLSAKVGDIHLLLPGLDTAAFLAPLGGKPSHQLWIGAYRINKIRVDRAQTSERWEMLSEPVDAGLRRVEDNQMILCIRYPETRERIVGKTGEELMLVVAIQSTHASGLPQQSTHYIRLDPRGSGSFPSVAQVPPSPHAPLLPVEPLMLELAAHV